MAWVITQPLPMGFPRRFAAIGKVYIPLSGDFEGFQIQLGSHASVPDQQQTMRHGSHEMFADGIGGEVQLTPDGGVAQAIQLSQ